MDPEFLAHLIMCTVNKKAFLPSVKAIKDKYYVTMSFFVAREARVRARMRVTKRKAGRGLRMQRSQMREGLRRGCESRGYSCGREQVERAVAAACVRAERVVAAACVRVCEPRG